MTIQTIRDRIDAMSTRSAWKRGVNAYAHELLDTIEEAIDGGYFDTDDLTAPNLLKRALLNGASDWKQYSWGGISLIYNSEIAQRLCTPSELRKTHDGELRPNSSEDWLDVQARALFQAARRIARAIQQ